MADFIRCDDEFETVGEDLDMSKMNAVRGTPKYVLPDISHELAMLGLDENLNKIKEDKRMLPVGTKVVVRGCNDYMGKLTGRVGTVCKHYPKANKIGVKFEDLKNPDSKDGVFWFQEKNLMMYKEPTPMMSSDDVKSVIFSGSKTIVLWSDGTKTIATCGAGDTFDPYAGFCAAVTKRVFGTTNGVKRILKQNTKPAPKKNKDEPPASEKEV